MKELINDLIQKSGLSNEEFAKAIGISPTHLSNKKNLRHVNVKTLVSWCRIVKVWSIESNKDDHYVKINVKF